MIKQFMIIFGCLAIGELVVGLTGLKLPSSILGMIVLTCLLKFGWVKMKDVKTITDFFVANLAFFFVPAGVGLILYFNIIKTAFIPIVISVLISTVLILAVTGWIHQIARKKR